MTSLSSPRIKPAEARVKCAYGVGSALLLALSLATTPARAEPTRWLGLALDMPSLAQSSRLMSSPPLALAPRPVSATDAQLAALMATRPALEYTPRDSSLTLSLEPGSYCTGACLKLVGSF